MNNEKETSVAFTGYREEKILRSKKRSFFSSLISIGQDKKLLKDISELTYSAVERLYEKGCVNFYTGMSEGYDMIGALSVLQLRDQHSDIRIPMVNGWSEVETSEWQPTNYDLWRVVSYDGAFYTLMSLDDFDNNITPYKSDCWGMIADYDSEHNEYNLEGHDYVVYDGKVFYPAMDVNSDVPIIGHNIAIGDPRNYNLKKHMVRIALYELTKTIAPNNVSSIRMRDYEDSMTWLYNASKLKLNPQIPRKLAGSDNAPITDWQLATFQTNYDPYQNPWMV